MIHCEPVGATATLIAQEYFSHRITPDAAMAGLMIAAILSDTISFRSATTTDEDHTVAHRLQPLAGIDLDAFGLELHRTKTAASAAKTVAEMLSDDFKEFLIGGRSIGIAQVEVADAATLSARREEVLGEMRTFVDAQGLSQLIFMATDVNAEGSDLWFAGDDRELFERAFGSLEGECRGRSRWFPGSRPPPAPHIHRSLSAIAAPIEPDPPTKGFILPRCAAPPPSSF